MASDLSQHGDSPISTCTTCNTPLVEDQALDDIKRIYAPYHACVSWTYVRGERADEALLRIRKALKEAAGWWTDQDQRDYDEAVPNA